MIPSNTARGAAKLIIAASLFITALIAAGTLLSANSAGVFRAGTVQAAVPRTTLGNLPQPAQVVSNLPKQPSLPSDSLVISQVYGGGGNSGAPLHNDFIEIFNKGTSPVDITGWSVQYASATGGSWQVTALTGVVPPGGYYLVQEAAGAGGGEPLPIPDATGNIAMSSTAAKIALVSDSTALTGTCPTGSTIVDLVGYGATANCFEGTGPTGAPSNSSSVTRAGDGCTDSDDNASDFAVSTTIVPRNSATPQNSCGGSGGTSTATRTPGAATNTAVRTQTPAATSTPGGATNTRIGTPPPSSGSMSISQVYGGGGNSGAPWHNDFIEIFNKGTSPVDVTGWSVQYASATGASWQVSGPLAGVVPPGGYYLIQESAGAGGGEPLPTPDATGNLAMSSTVGKIALVSDSTALTGSCPTGSSLIDLVGYGATASCFEGTGPTGAPSNSTSVTRAGNGCTDTNNNAADFSVATEIVPRNSAVPQNPCGPIGSHTATITPGGPTFTPTRTPSPTITLEPASGVVIYMLHYTQYDTSTVTIGDEAIRLMNNTPDSIIISNWRISNGPGNVQLPSPVVLPSYSKIWIANRATTFRRWFGFNPDFEYGADTDPNVPQATASPNFSFVDSGGVITLLNQTGGLEDTLVYKSGTTPSPGWTGPAVRPFLPAGQPAFTEKGQILYRKLDETTGRPVSDTNTDNDWAQDNDSTGSTPTPGREFDDVTAKRLLRPGWALTDPEFEDMYSTKSYTNTNVTTKFLVDPDNGADAIRNMILSASESITIETYEWHNSIWAQDIIDAHNRGVFVSVVFEGNPCCDEPTAPTTETLWTAKLWEEAGIPVYFLSGRPATTDDTYRYNNVHAKIIVIDREWVITGTDNFAMSTMPSDNRANGTAGSRGAMIITNAPDVVSHTLRMVGNDFAIGKYPDIVRYPALGTPPPNFTPPPVEDRTGYTPIKPTPLVVTETQNIEIIQAPDNTLRYSDSLIGMVGRAGAGDNVMVQQQYERKYWESSTTNGPNPRLEAYIRAARRGANVRILLDGFYEGGDCSSGTHNPATVAYINGLGLPNLQAKVGQSTGGFVVRTGTPEAVAGNIHAKIVLVTAGGGARGYLHVSSINGSLNSSKNNREYGLQIQSNAGYQYYKDVFDVDWSRGYLPCGQTTPTPVVTGTPPTATQTPLACNLLSNPGFETGSLGPWTTTTPGITAQVVESPANSGEFAVGVTSVFTVGNGGSQGIQQNINNILGGATYRISAAVLRGAANIQSARIRITWYPCPNQSCSGTNDDMILGNNSPNWQTISTLKIAPADAMSAKFKPVFYTSDGNPATIYFDDLLFDCNGNPTTTPAPGTGTAVVTPTSGMSTTPVATATRTRTPLITLTPPGMTPTPSNCDYTYTQSTGALEISTNDSGNHCDDCSTRINLPFAARLYDQYFTTADVGANGYIQFASGNTFFTRCLPAPGLAYTILPYFGDLNTNCGGCGIFTSVTGSVPNRVFHIEWRANDSGGNNNFEVRLYEGSPSVFQIVYGALARGGQGAMVGVQKDADNFTQYSCSTGTVNQGMKITFVNNCSGPVLTPTPMPTPPTCSMSFSDLQPDDHFYLAVRYLYCRGVVTGYGDHTFRPYDSTTRSQLTKIIVIAMGWPVDTSNGPHFSDVAENHPFYGWVETAYHHSVISGYEGGIFHPYNHITRAQMSKVIVQAMRWPMNTANGPHFTDVPQNAPLYEFIETAYNYSIVRGYSDGTFRPNDRVTRNEVSMILNLAFNR